jgi:putative DNA-invertase from lambdoid prophage Rac
MKLLDRLERDDVLVVTKMDRLGRNAIDVAIMVDKLPGMGLRVYCLALGAHGPDQPGRKDDHGRDQRGGTVRAGPAD